MCATRPGLYCSGVGTWVHDHTRHILYQLKFGPSSPLLIFELLKVANTQKKVAKHIVMNHFQGQIKKKKNHKTHLLSVLQK